jgi:hypothetical protein
VTSRTTNTNDVRTAITNAHIVLGTGETIADGVVVLDGDRIASVDGATPKQRPTKALI